MAAWIDLAPPDPPYISCILYAGGIMPSLEQMLSLRTRDLLATKWRKAKIEKSISYEGKPIDVRPIHDWNQRSLGAPTPVDSIQSISLARACMHRLIDSHRFLLLVTPGVSGCQIFTLVLGQVQEEQELLPFHLYYWKVEEMRVVSKGG